MSDKNPFPDEGNTGHIWDDNIRELDNPPPSWWIKGFWLSIIFWFGYLIIYPAIPLINTHTKGIAGWTSVGELKKSLAIVEARRKPFEDKVAQMSSAELLADKDLMRYVEAAGKVLFGDNCAGCHATGGAGNPNYPVLADDDWLFGGTVAQIETSISEGRKASMPAYEGIYSTSDIKRLAEFVVASNIGKEDKEGLALFTEKGCGGCHGADAKGLVFLGSSNLVDSIWRFSPGNTQGAIQTITYGVNAHGKEKTRKPNMPAFKDRLSESDIKKLAVYVHNFGGGL